MNNFENSRNYLKLNLEFPEYNKGFRWILRARCGYKIDTRVAKAVKMINNSCPKYCLFNSLVVTSDNSSVNNRINNIVKGYKSSNNIRINNISNIDILEWLFKCQTESGTYSKSPFLLRSAALLNDIMPVVYKRQHILFNKFKTNLSRNINTNNTVGQPSPSRANADTITDLSGIG
ncbi:hypothetical protein BCR32DRAFT_293527 [Anaeromyces robustus]|uniref:Uncharacterized protein n=1 Tax=Anaeromyces robustus TaxID=1754192 RepID=A0A1Y1X5G9_9FUNG|nr:hypothetical protein BCR32DRAFT_293527 [Anaeromyces robustus]|eukprot:ORX81023.1 hypothetical protein BCR32DRAFT_293527 [Anaeromyces robustus]